MDVTIRFPAEATGTQIRAVLDAARIFAFHRGQEATEALEAVVWSEIRNSLGDALIQTYVQEGDPGAQP